MNNKTEDEFYVIEAVLIENHKPLDEQVLEYRTYAVCESWDIARQIELKDGPHGRRDFVRSRILGPFPLQTQELV
ncbi:hypothetical protein CL634_10695 [bacterium]|nr:hypothetical protein [bacterium]